MNIIETIKSWWYNLFNKSDIAQSLGLDSESLEYNDMLGFAQTWKRIWSGSEFEDMKDPKIAATVCHEAARLVVSEMKVELGDSPRAKYISDLLQRQVINRAGELTEYACAMGGLILKPRFDGEKIVTDTITQDLFFPTQYDDEGIYGGIFIEQKKKGKYTFTRLEHYKYMGSNVYQVENKAYKSNYGANNLDKEVPLSSVSEWQKIEPVVTITGAPLPIFAYYKMPGANYIDPNNPMGVSLFGKSIDSIKAAVTAYNALDWEIEGGELKRYRDISTFTEFDDKNRPIPDRKRQKEYIFNGASGETNGTKLFETYSPNLRVNDQITALNRHLNQIEAQTGFSQGTFSIDTKSGMATATQVVADNQKTYSTIHDIQTKSFETALNQLINIYDFYASVYNLAPKGDIVPSFEWDDSIIEDTTSEFARRMQLVQNGYLDPANLIGWYFNISEDEAKKMIPKQDPAMFDQDNGS